MSMRLRAVLVSKLSSKADRLVLRLMSAVNVHSPSLLFYLPLVQLVSLLLVPTSGSMQGLSRVGEVKLAGDVFGGSRRVASTE